jgi:hypothetical protein
LDNDDGRRHGDEGYDSDEDDRKRNRKKSKDKKTGSANTDTTSGVGSADDDPESRNSIEFIDFDAQTSPRRTNNVQVRQKNNFEIVRARCLGQV